MHPYYYVSRSQPNQYTIPSVHTPQHPYWYTPYIPVPINRNFPAVNPNLFMESAKEMEDLMHNASTLLSKMAQDRQFSIRLMTAAQASKQAEVEAMLKSTGIKNVPEVSYTPSGLWLVFASAEGSNANLSLRLRWM